MADSSYSKLLKQIEALQAKADRVRRAEVAEVVSKIRSAINVYGLSETDLFVGIRRIPISNSPATRSPKIYSDGLGGEWKGIGKRPRWLSDALAAGRSLEEFLVGRVSAGGKSAAAHTFSKSTAAKRKSGPKKASKGRGAKYGDDAGNSWSGMGRKPGWFLAAIAGGKTPEDFFVRQ